MRELGPQEIHALGTYVVAMHAGPTYNGSLCGFDFQRGIAANGPHPGTIVYRSGIVRVAHVWAHLEGHALTWVIDSWSYAPVPVPHNEPPSPLVTSADTEGEPQDFSRKRPMATRRKARE